MNGLVVLCLPLLAGALLAPHYDATVHPPGWSPVLSALRAFLRSTAPMLPLAAIAVWRTWAHAQRWQQGDRDAVAVAEATGCGMATAWLLAMAALPAARSSPLAVLLGLFIVSPYGAVAGACVGLLLFSTAVVVLTLGERALRVRGVEQ